MKIDVAVVRQCLKSFDFSTLFREHLGWDNCQIKVDIPVDGRNIPLCALAQKRGFVAFACDGPIPDRATRLKIDHQTTKSVREHFVIYADKSTGQQVWQWVRREQGKPLASRDHRFDIRQSGDPLIQRLDQIAVTLDEEEEITVVDVAGRARAAFDVDRITKRFYDRFKSEHTAFLNFVKGIKAEADLQWYTSLMLNRLMFIYFIQKKGFLDGDTDYLRNRLQRVQQARGKDKFQSFYRYFLLRLFHEGLGRSPEERRFDPIMEELLGKVPFLNGGFFEVHDLEKRYLEIDIPDKAFEKLFDFFDQYSWHLDERPLRADNEINPDVVGYIFEKYVNQKQMGAYYTKEDITEYISKNTVIPFIFDAAQKKCAIAFNADSALWRLLRDNPDRYIYPAVRHGVIHENGSVVPETELPDYVRTGMNDPNARMSDNRYNLQQAQSGDPLRLVTETWREYVYRRNRCLEVRKKLHKGEVHQINDLITLNLDIWQLARDAIINAEGPELLRAFWQAIEKVTVLDPTCGSGAFLFAALRILETLYSDCLERMERFIEDLEAKPHHPEQYGDFKKVLAQIAKHPNDRYFILKSIIINNLFGVDIMEEAIEICKLRLFLKLVAQVEAVEQIEPLPDIDFNIRAGNTLVGFASLEQVKKSMEGDWIRLQSLPRIEEDAEMVERAFRQFRAQQTVHGGKITHNDKLELRKRLAKLDDELDRYLAGDYGINVKNQKEFEAWKISHQPFHWFVEYYGIMNTGGFDVVIGNPPYVVFSETKVGYKLKPDAFKTFECKNLYGYVFEQSLAIASQQASVGLIVQLTALSAEKMTSLQDILLNRGQLFCLAFPRRPESMFDGVEMPVVIQLSLPGDSRLLTSRISRFYTDERPCAVDTIALHEHAFKMHGHRIAKLGNHTSASAFTRVIRHKTTFEHITVSRSEHLLYYQEACRYWAKASKGYPYFKRNGKAMPPPHGRILPVLSESACAFAACLMNSSLFYWWYSTLSDCEHINDSLVRRMPIPDDWECEKWFNLWMELSKSLKNNAMPKSITTRQGHKIEYLEMNAALSKPIIDQIDRALAKHYGFTEEELDFIINYDIKYRMGLDSGEGGDE